MAMRWSTRRRGGADGIYEPNMTPLIDVSLVLVVILMVATPMAFQSSIAVNAAASSGRSARETARTQRTELVIRADGSVRVNREVVPRADLGRSLAPLLQASATRMVIVRCEPGVTHGSFVGVIDIAKALGASPIAVQGRS
jgi:biopolymer transport protein ExbD